MSTDTPMQKRKAMRFRRWWVRTRPAKNQKVAIDATMRPAAIELFVPWWAWPLAMLHRLIFGRTRLAN